MSPDKRMTTRLMEIFNRPGLTIVPGGSTPFHAIMNERAGYEAFYMSGSMTSQWIVGWPDVGVTTMREMADNINRIAKAVDIPVFSDCDTGYGTAVNVYRTIKDYIWAGCAGCHIEDQEFPKKSGTMAGRRLITIEEAVGKYKAAMDAKGELDADFVIVARTDARGAEGGGFEEVIKRAKAYREEAGVDVLMFEGLQSWEECKIAMGEVDCPSFCNIHLGVGGKAIEVPSLEQREKDGEKIYLAVATALMAGNQAHWEMLVNLKKRGMQAVDEWRQGQQDKPQEMMLPTDLISISRIREMEEKYLPKFLQRDYESTIGRRAGDPGT